jgi:hypothetical protein
MFPLNDEEDQRLTSLFVMYVGCCRCKDAKRNAISMPLYGWWWVVRPKRRRWRRGEEAHEEEEEEAEEEEEEVGREGKEASVRLYSSSNRVALFLVSPWFCGEGGGEGDVDGEVGEVGEVGEEGAAPSRVLRSLLPTLTADWRQMGQVCCLFNHSSKHSLQNLCPHRSNSGARCG